MNTSHVEGWKAKGLFGKKQLPLGSAKAGGGVPVGCFCLDSHVLSLLKRDGRLSGLVLALMYVIKSGFVCC